MTAALVLEGVRRAFGGVAAVDGAALAVAPGTVHGLIGPNGSGKTTVINLISGLLRADAGTIAVGGRAVGGLPAHRIAALGVARTFQNIRLFPELSARHNVLVGEHLHRRASLPARLALLPSARAEERAAAEIAAALLARVGLAARAEEKARHLSYGEQRRVEIARALAARPRVLLLDEPTAGMNPVEVQAIAALIRQVAADGCAVLLVEHNVRLVMDVCDHLTVLNFGRVIADGAPPAVVSDPAVIAAYLGSAPA
ncbi:MAG TPA: ABC transporter ATP-binding protein [Polyangia bacterium]|nr:ABC transporter ATP-binding protein [Polyangia bacterium]